MSKLHKLTIVVVSLAFFAACEQDDLVDTLPLRDRAVQQIADRDSLLSYMTTMNHDRQFVVLRGL